MQRKIKFVDSVLSRGQKIKQDYGPDFEFLGICFGFQMIVSHKFNIQQCQKK